MCGYPRRKGKCRARKEISSRCCPEDVHLHKNIKFNMQTCFCLCRSHAQGPIHTHVRPSLHAFPSTRCRVEWHPTRNLMCMKLIPTYLPSGWQATGGESFLASWVPEGTTTTTTDASFVMLDYYCAKSMTFAMVPCFPMMTSE